MDFKYHDSILDFTLTKVRNSWQCYNIIVSKMLFFNEFLDAGRFIIQKYTMWQVSIFVLFILH